MKMEFNFPSSKLWFTPTLQFRLIYAEIATITSKITKGIWNQWLNFLYNNLFKNDFLSQCGVLSILIWNEFYKIHVTYLLTVTYLGKILLNTISAIICLLNINSVESVCG